MELMLLFTNIKIKLKMNYAVVYDKRKKKFYFSKENKALADAADVSIDIVKASRSGQIETETHLFGIGEMVKSRRGGGAGNNGTKFGKEEKV
jgi:hypothetical protein